MARAIRSWPVPPPASPRTPRRRIPPRAAPRRCAPAARAAQARGRAGAARTPPKSNRKTPLDSVAAADRGRGAVGLGIGYKMMRSNYYVGADSDRVAILRGVPASVFGYPDAPGGPGRLCLQRDGQLNLVESGPDLPPDAKCCRSAISSRPSTAGAVGHAAGLAVDARRQMSKLAPATCCRYARAEPPTHDDPAPPAPPPPPGAPAPAARPARHHSRPRRREPDRRTAPLAARPGAAAGGPTDESRPADDRHCPELRGRTAERRVDVGSAPPMRAFPVRRAVSPPRRRPRRGAAWNCYCW